MPGPTKPNGGTELSRFQRLMHRGYPVGTRTRERLLVLWGEIWDAGKVALGRWQRKKEGISNKDQVAALDREFSQWAKRMRVYREILRNPSSSKEQLDRNVIRGLLFSPGKGTHIADALFPISFSRRVDILLTHERERLILFFRDMAVEAREILETAKEGGIFVGENIRPILLGATATIVGGLILHAMVTRRR